MPDIRGSEVGDTPVIEVLVYRGGELVERCPCDTEEEAAEVVASREETPGVACVVADLSGGPLDEGSTETEPPDAGELYPVDGIDAPAERG